METLYDVQQLLKQFGIYIYVGARIYDVELMMTELKRLYGGQLVNRDTCLRARHVLRREHRVEESRGKQKGIDQMDKKIIGVDLGGMTIEFAILTTDGVVQQKWSIETSILEDGKHVVPSTTESIRYRIGLYNMKKEDFVGIGMGTPGSIDIGKRTVMGACNLNWTTIRPVKGQIESALRIPFALDNDTNVAALGKRWKGAGEDNPGAIFITLGTDVSGDIVTTGKLLHGITGCAGEVGHVMVDPNDFNCACEKRDCLETVSNAIGVVRVTHHLSEKFTGDSELKRTIDDGQDVSGKDVFEFVKEGDHFALMVADRVCFYLGLATGDLGNTLNPDSMVIDGGVSTVGEFLRGRTEKYFQELTFPQARSNTKIKLAEPGNEANATGAASLALRFPKEK